LTEQKRASRHEKSHELSREKEKRLNKNKKVEKPSTEIQFNSPAFA